jgi:hypothetical protein
MYAIKNIDFHSYIINIYSYGLKPMCDLHVLNLGLHDHH